MGFSLLPRVCLCIASVLTSSTLAAQPPTQSPGADENTAFEQARAKSAPEDRIAAFNGFLARFPTSAHTRVAQEALLTTYLNAYPDRVRPIHTTAAALIAAAAPGLERWIEESRIADLLASAEPKGADLPDAETWAKTALDALTEPAYRHETTVAQLKYKLPKLPQKQIHEQFIGYRASFLATAAHVALDKDETSHANDLLTEAFQLNPLSGEVNALRGQLALALGQSETALECFERADAMGRLNPALRQRELELFQALKHGDSEALNRRVDEVYHALYPRLYVLSPRQLPAGGHTVLLELFTGSGCMPCAGPDLAIESLLTTYNRQDLAVLEYDEHIPRPDPLTTPDTITRAAFYNVASTPEAYLDGQPLQVLGAARADVENVVIGFADAIENEAAFPSGLQISVAVSRSTTGDLHADVTLTPTPVPHAKPDETTGDTSLRALARARVFAALVQDNIRYSGENGVRFHRMVVRAVQQASAASFLNTNAQRPTLRFQLAAIQQANTAYLTNFQTTNDRFGTCHFSTTDFPLRMSDLSLVVWVQDPATKQVLQTAVAALPSD
jgi:tetratricopeptide (TPR) repeat protein